MMLREALIILAMGALTACAPGPSTEVPVPVEATMTPPQPAATDPLQATSAVPVATTPSLTATATLAALSTPLFPTGTTADVAPELSALPQVTAAKADLAGRLGVAPIDIQVLLVQPTTWTDSSMGCPQPGMDYLQVLVEGLSIQLGYDGATYNYHSGGSQPPFLCEQPTGGVLVPEFDFGKTAPAPPPVP